MRWSGQLARMRAWVIGRSADCDVAVNDPTVSRRHVEVVCLPDGYIHVTDRSTTNGTFVLEASGWRQARQEFVGPAVGIRLGNYETTAAEIGAQCIGGVPPTPEPRGVR